MKLDDLNKLSERTTLTGLRLGLLINFHVAVLKDGIRRMISG
jgi:hypothetical protein